MSDRDDANEEITADRDLGQLEVGGESVAHEANPDLDNLLLQAGQGLFRHHHRAGPGSSRVLFVPNGIRNKCQVG